MLTETAVHAANDRRATFVGVEAYEAAGGEITRDLFENDHGGWLQDPALLDRLHGRRRAHEAPYSALARQRTGPWAHLL